MASINEPESQAYLFKIGQWVVTWWKLVGYMGVFCFGLRWIVQLLASHKARRSTIPLLFWTITLLGCVFQLSYFVWGKNDSVGILSSAFPAGLAIYNIYLELARKKAPKDPE